MAGLAQPSTSGVIARELGSNAGIVFVWQQWDVDVIAAVDASKMPGQFNRSWTHVLAEVARKLPIG
jgi:hypothetical protein